MSADDALVAEDVRIVRGGRALLDGVSVTLRPGELLAVVGKNGAGKSTLLGALGGDVAIDGGRVQLNGAPLSGFGSTALARARAVLAQETQLAFDFPVCEVVALGRYARRGDDAARNAAAVGACMALTHVDGLAQRAVTTLSGGERARVHLARVLAQLDAHEAEHHAPRYALLDEPAASLDLAHQIDLFALLRRVSRLGRIGILVTVHDLNLAARYADRVLILRDGQVLADAVPETALTEAALDNGFDVDARIQTHPAGGRLIVAMDRMRRAAAAPTNNS